MFANHGQWPDANRPQQITSEDFSTLLRLSARYGPVNLMFVLRSFSEPSRVSTVSQCTLSSNASVPSLSWSTSEPSICPSDTASILSHSTQTTWTESAPDLNYLQREVGGVQDPAWISSTTPPQPAPDLKVPESPMPSIMNPAPSGRKAIECTMCFVEGIVVGFTRKSDFKKHLQHFHSTNSIWVCTQPGCTLTFDFEKAYVAHAKASHSDVHLPPRQARVDICPQLVFACGFKGCKDRIFEATNEEDALALKDKYFDHVAKHFDMGFCVAEWDYYTQISNLLRQEALKDIWKQCVWQKSVRNGLRWQPRAAADLKRLLEYLKSTYLNQQSFEFRISHLNPPAAQGVYRQPSRGKTCHPALQHVQADGWSQPHPGTPFPVQDVAPRWPEDEPMFIPHTTDGIVDSTPNGVDHPMGGMASPEPVQWPLTAVDAHLRGAFDNDSRPKTPKRPLSVTTRRSLENLRLKRRGGPDMKTELDDSSSISLDQTAFDLPMRTSHHSLTTTQCLTSPTTFYHEDPAAG